MAVRQTLPYHPLPMTLPLLLIALGIALAAPGIWLWLRPASSTTLMAALALLLLATASTYIGARLWMDQRKIATEDFVLEDIAGQFQVIPPASLPAALAAAHGRPVLLEFYADWCPSCLVWKNTVFPRKDVQEAMAPLVLLQIDATELGPEVQALLDQYGLAGLPAMLVYDMGGRERPELRLLGEMTPEAFIDWINRTMLPAL